METHPAFTKKERQECMERQKIAVSLIIALLTLTVITLPLIPRARGSEDKTREVSLDEGEYFSDEVSIEEGWVGIKVWNATGDFDFFLLTEAGYEDFEDSGEMNVSAISMERKVSSLDESGIEINDGPSWVVLQNADNESITMKVRIYWGETSEVWWRGGVCCGAGIVGVAVFGFAIYKWKGWLRKKLLGGDEKVTREKKEELEELKAEVEELKKEKDQLEKKVED